MDERLRFVARLLDGEKMAALCREFDISRKTGYKIFQRYKDCGVQGLTDRSRRPYPITWEEQDRLFPTLPAHLQRMVLFAVNTGLRDSNVCGLQWTWESSSRRSAEA